MSEYREFQPRHVIAIVPADADLTFPVQGLRVSNETAGWLSLKVRNANGNPNAATPGVDVTLRIPPATVVYEPGQFSRVWATGTDAASLTIHGYADRLVNTQ
jgi:hypothetical protein